MFQTRKEILFEDLKLFLIQFAQPRYSDFFDF